jgi:hypothetical protein
MCTLPISAAWLVPDNFTLLYWESTITGLVAGSCEHGNEHQ